MGTGSTLRTAPVKAPKSPTEMAFLRELERGEHWHGPPEVRVNGGKVPLARAVFAVYNGYTPAHVPVVSECGDETCVRPEHLALRVPPKRSARSHGEAHGENSPRARAQRYLVGNISSVAGERRQLRSLSREHVPREERERAAEAETREMYEFYQRGFSQIELAALFGIAQATIAYRFRKYGYKARSRSEGTRLAKKRQADGTYTARFAEDEEVASPAS